MRHCTSAAVITAAALLALTGCGSQSGTDGSPDPEATTVETVGKAPGSDATGIFPDPPTPAERQAYLDALDAIDPDIVHGKEDKAVSRGRSTCQTLTTDVPGGREALIDMTNTRFTSPAHPGGHGVATAEQILNAAHTHLCPEF
ncbi:DUF732 domain-containing protein [Streptomyces sp. PR69]|uniref:DUF732 domain-containing protein n=1 Tax=Streptomyces sp. PR69 TaxID=2984950 RepID=UPI0022655302|nr:DUF732 domain-containing protein [Streptomyces sp. PR69]